MASSSLVDGHLLSLAPEERDAASRICAAAFSNAVGSPSSGIHLKGPTEAWTWLWPSRCSHSRV